MAEYSPARRQAAADLQVEAGELQKEVSTASDYAAFYVRNMLYLASALFLVGISRMFFASKVRLAIQVLALGLVLFGVLNSITGPIA